jgi:hypothetical protein
MCSDRSNSSRIGTLRRRMRAEMETSNDERKPLASNGRSSSPDLLGRVAMTSKERLAYDVQELFSNV